MERQPNGTSFLVTPELTKGTISLVKGSDGLTHFQWTDRSTNTVVDDWIVFPDDAVLSKVSTGVSNDRVYLLQWRAPASRQVMFWMQDKLPTEDADNCRKFNEYMSAPPAQGNDANPGGADLMRLLGRAGRPAAATAAPAGAAAVPASIGGFDFSQLLQGALAQPAAAPASTPAAATRPAGAAPATGGGLTAQDFQNAMMGLSGEARPREPTAELRDVLRGDQIVNSGALSDPQVIADLLPLLPEGQQTPQHLEQAIRSPQLQQAVDDLQNAIESDPTGAVIANFGMTPPAGGVSLVDPVGTFLDAVQSQHGGQTPSASSSSAQETPAREQKEDDSKMDESS